MHRLPRPNHPRMPHHHHPALPAAAPPPPQIHYGAGAYICGEETALIESLEGANGAGVQGRRAAGVRAAGCRLQSRGPNPGLGLVMGREGSRAERIHLPPWAPCVVMVMVAVGWGVAGGCRRRILC